MSTRSTIQGDRNPGGRARRECGRETEGDRRRKSLRHGWARLPGDGSLSGKALKFETAASELFPPWEVEARRPWTAHSLCGSISSRKHLLSSSFCWFSGFQPFKPRVDINHCVSGGTRWPLQQRRREQSTGEIPALSGLTPLYVNIGISRREEEGRGDVGNPYTGVIVRVLTFFFSSSSSHKNWWINQVKEEDGLM